MPLFTVGTNCTVLPQTGLPQFWKVLEFENGPGKSWNFTYICQSPGKVLEFYTAPSIFFLSVQNCVLWCFTFQFSLLNILLNIPCITFFFTLLKLLL